MKRALSGIGCALVLLASAVFPAAADREGDLQHLQGAVRESRERVSAYEKQGRGLFEAIGALDRAALALEREVVLGRRRAEQARLNLQKIESDVASIRVALEQTERAMSRRAVGLYKAGEAGTLRMLFAVDGLRDFLSRVNALRLLLVHDAEILGRYRRQSAELLAAESSNRQAGKHWNASVAELSTRSDQLDREREAKQQLIARVHADRSHERAALIELETASRALEETLESLGEVRQDAAAGASAGTRFGRRKGRLKAPVSAPIVSQFGRSVDGSFQTEVFKRGVEFAAKRGVPVRSVGAGVVRFAGWFGGYGRLVILDHGDDYFTVFGHLAEFDVEPGAEVAEGQRIGEVGDTGSLEGPRLYFEIRQGNRPLDPREWLAMREGR